MLRKEVFHIAMLLNQIQIEDANIVFKYGISKNKNMLKSIVQKIQEKQQPSDELVAYDKERSDLCQKYAIKDDKGIYVIDKGNYTFSDENQELLHKELENLMKNKYPNMIENNKKQTEDYQIYMDEEFKDPINFYKIKLNVVPDNLKQEVMDVLTDIIFVESIL
jgi:hypothetical protein